MTDLVNPDWRWLGHAQVVREAREACGRALAAVPAVGSPLAWTVATQTMHGVATSPAVVVRGLDGTGYRSRWTMRGPVRHDGVRLADVHAALADPDDPASRAAVRTLSEGTAVVAVDRLRGHLLGHRVTEACLVTTKALVAPATAAPEGRWTLPLWLGQTPLGGPGAWVVTAWETGSGNPIIPPGSKREARSFAVRAEASVEDLVRTVVHGFDVDDTHHLWAVSNTATAHFATDGPDDQQLDARARPWGRSAGQLVRPGDLARLQFNLSEGRYFTLWRRPDD